jgi:hypothetical protein
LHPSFLDDPFQAVDEGFPIKMFLINDIWPIFLYIETFDIWEIYMLLWGIEVLFTKFSK